MTKTTLKEIKRLIKNGTAQDLTSGKEIPRSYNKIAYSFGIYGINGGIIEDSDGNLYGITGRTANLFRIF